ncbi:hypothetical protein WJX73_002529 [Symbiochloris irregularis]|uniref:Phosphodiesterase n=1 Tax=Symbiochloris irregularis TaxID=706552 RepID=A0AAW1PRF7_9CHLO
MDSPANVCRLFADPEREGGLLLETAFGESLIKDRVGQAPTLQFVEEHLKRATPWTLAELSLFDDYKLPCWVKRPILHSGSVRHIIYLNKVAKERFGPPLTADEVLEAFSRITQKERDFFHGVLSVLADRVERKRETLALNVYLPNALGGTFHAELPEEHACHHERGIDIRFGDRVVRCYFSVLEPALNAVELRGAAMAASMPIHYYLFSATGKLLYANQKARTKLQHDGHTVANFTLADLLDLPGIDQGHFAKAALDAIITKNLPHHELTLCTPRSSGQIRHTLHEMWPARDPVNNLAPAVLVSAFNVTHLKETEMELQKLRVALQRRNADLRKDLQLAVDGRAGLEAEREVLQARLEEALQLPKSSAAPMGPLATTSPLDRVATLLESLLQGAHPGTGEVLDLRNSLLRSEDLRRPDDFHAQIQRVSGLTVDAGRSLATLLADEQPALVGQIARISTGAFQRASKHRRDLPQTLLQESARRGDARLWSGDLHELHLIEQEGGAVPYSITPEVERLLMGATTSWSFDMVELDRATNGHCLSCYAFFLFQQSLKVAPLSYDLEQLASFLQAIEAGYQESNPYHNRMHAASVLHMVDLLAKSPSGLLDLGIVETTLLRSMYLAAVCHDFDHPGVTNDFLVKTRSVLAILYNDASPLENHHASASQKLWLERFGDESSEDGAEISSEAVGLRSTFISLILGTDMKQHFPLMSRFQGAVQLGVFDMSKSAPEGIPAHGKAGKREDHSKMSIEHRLLAMQIALKAADIGHLALPRALHCTWVERLQNEFFAQGDREREAGLAISPLMDRNKSGTVASSQVGFFDVVALPLLRAIATITPCGQQMLDSATANYIFWKEAVSPAETSTNTSTAASTPKAGAGKD